MMGIAAVIYDSVPDSIAQIHTNVHSMRRGDPASTWALYHICPGMVRCHITTLEKMCVVFCVTPEYPEPQSSRSRSYSSSKS